MSAEQDTTKPVAAAAAPVAPAAEEKAPAPAPAPVEAPSADDKPTEEEEKPAVETPLTKLAARLPEITKSVGHTEMWGVQLSDDVDAHVPTKVVLQKFLRANNSDAAAAEKQLVAALEWRKKMNPPALVDASYDEAKFGGLGYVTVHEDEAGKQTVITWNIYGAVKSFKTTFGNLDEFIQWRTALMEFGVQKLNLASVTEPIPEDGQDPYQMIQVHDYLSVSFLRMDPHVKAASSETIKVFSTAYPELLAHKYFVNVPTIMGWMYAAMKLFLAPATLKKFHPMSSGTTLATELPGITSTLPKEYGGKGAGLKEQGLIIKLDGAKEEIPQDAGEAPVAAVTEGKAEEAKAVEQPAEKPVETTKTEEIKPAAVETNPDAPVAAAVTEAETKPLAATEEKPAEVKAA